MSTGYISPADYVASPRNTDPADLLDQAQLRVYVLKGIVAEQDREIDTLQRTVNELCAEGHTKPR